jgi:hypothetical protein
MKKKAVPATVVNRKAEDALKATRALEERVVQLEDQIKRLGIWIAVLTVSNFVMFCVFLVAY